MTRFDQEAERELDALRNPDGTYHADPMGTSWNRDAGRFDGPDTQEEAMSSDSAVYILAGNYQQAVDASRALPSDQRWRYVNEARQLFGVRGGTLIVSGTFWERRDASELYNLARRSGLDDSPEAQHDPE